MGITGYEVDIVRVGKDGDEESVPAFDAYNHHYLFYIKGRDWKVRWAVTPRRFPCGASSP